MNGLGIQLDSRHGRPFRGISFSDQESSASACVPTGMGYGVRRSTLHSLLVERANEVGVSFRWGVHVSGIDREGALVDGVRFSCKWLVGADGQNSLVAKWGGSQFGPPSLLTFRFFAPLRRTPVERFCRSLLGRGLPDVCYTHGCGRSLRGADFA